MAEDFYKTLGVSKNASQDEIQKAYLKMARKYHPDLNPKDPEGAKKKFQELQTAFETLKDPEKRRQYDQFGPDYERFAGGGNPFGAGGNPFGGGGNPFGGGFSGGGASFSFDDILNAFGGGASAGGGNPFGGGFSGGGNPFGGGRRRRSPAPQKGEDVTATVSVPLATAVLGGTIPVTIRRERGGMVSVDAKIPVGIETGKKIRLRGMGEPGVAGGPSGDVILEVEIAPHPFYSRFGKDLTVKTPITLKEAAFGAKVDVPTPRGTVAVTIPPGATSGTRLRLKGLGVAPDGEKPGDLYVECAVALPKSWSKEDLELLQKLDSDVPNVREKLSF